MKEIFILEVLIGKKVLMDFWKKVAKRGKGIRRKERMKMSVLVRRVRIGWEEV
jgi:hypothetical protein